MFINNLCLDSQTIKSATLHIQVQNNKIHEHEYFYFNVKQLGII